MTAVHLTFTNLELSQYTGDAVISRSSSILTDLTGTAVVAGSEAHYLPFGGYHGYTGQKENLDLGLMYYNGRYYIPGLGKFASADTLVPDPANPQALNRYSYVNNNPVKYIDPTGHCAELAMMNVGL